MIQLQHLTLQSLWFPCSPEITVQQIINLLGIERQHQQLNWLFWVHRLRTIGRGPDEWCWACQPAKLLVLCPRLHLPPLVYTGEHGQSEADWLAESCGPRIEAFSGYFHFLPAGGETDSPGEGREALAQRSRWPPAKWAGPLHSERSCAEAPGLPSDFPAVLSLLAAYLASSCNAMFLVPRAQSTVVKKRREKKPLSSLLNVAHRSGWTSWLDGDKQLS